jgi:hypothetical protein
LPFLQLATQQCQNQHCLQDLLFFVLATIQWNQLRNAVIGFESEANKLILNDIFVTFNNANDRIVSNNTFIADNNLDNTQQLPPPMFNRLWRTDDED